MKKENTHVLQKKIKDLTPEDMAALEKPLGVPGRPFPMWGSQRVEHDGRPDLVQVLSVIADDTYPLKVYSDRPYKEVVAMAYCDMPVPSMLPLFFDGLERRKPESENRTQMMIGDPGHGKSFLGALQGRLRSSGPVEVLDCGGKNMRELLFEMVLDFGAGEALPKAIDKRLQLGTLEPMSLGLLKGLPSEVRTLDADGGIASIDWNRLKTLGQGDVESAFEVLKKVSKVEGLDNAGGNALGMNSQYGPLIRKWMKGEELVLDEYNKSREGTDDNLQTVWQFFIGEIKECTIENPLKNKDQASGPSEFTFKREDLKAGFFITLTGNKKEDGVTTRSLNKSVYSRLSPQTLPDPDVADWQHRICQMMTGVPVSTLYNVFRDEANKNPDEFGDWLLALRKAKAEIEGVPVPALQETLLSNWKNVVNASEKLAKFYDRWASITDAEKITSNGNADLIDEVDEEYSKKEGVDFRKIGQHLKEAIPLRPHMQPFDMPVTASFKGWDKPPAPSEKAEENPSLNFGTRLTEFLERAVYEKSGAVGKQKLYQKLHKAMGEFGLRDVKLKEAAHSQQKSVEDDLNISVFADKDINRQADMARRVLCDYLRQLDPNITSDNEQIVTIKKVRDALKDIAARDTGETKEVFFVNRAPETLSAEPLVSATVRDTATYQAAGKKELDFTQEEVVHHDDFLASLALPTVGRKNLSAIWEGNIRAMVQEDDEALHMAENRSAQGIATTSLKVHHGDTEVSVHVVHNAARNKTLIVSEKAPSKLLSAFREAGIVHVNRNDPNAKMKIDAALGDLTRGAPESVRARLVDAFRYRNEVAPDNKADIADLLTDRNIDMTFPKFVVRNNRKAL